MSERKSWDIAPKPAKPAAPKAPEHPVATHAPTLGNGPRRGQARRAAARPLREQRKKKRRAFWFVVAALIVALIAGALYVIWLPAVRVNAISVQGPDAEGVKRVAADAMAGTYWFGVPRNSIFLLPERQMRMQILNAYPDIEAVSIKGESLQAIAITAAPRATAFVWCGSDITAPPADGACFSADAAGLIFAPLDPAAVNASSTLRIFAPLDREVAPGASPIRAHVKAAKQIPDALRLVKALRSLNAPVSALAITGDEGDFYLNGPTKILYVLGHEEQAAELAASALPKLNLTDGSIDYIDLRFVSAPGQPGKVYVKRFGQ
ncbi:MAG TPA: hypothetical protein VGN56_00720 [Candidatus Paceibacterota bacterium]|jgi:cell division septal protein FtsQ|nr:hypothetical protein [Candidatus Paceibacterota bacterium]